MAEQELKKMEYSEELNELIRFIREKLSQELPTLNIDIDYFILGMFLEKKSALYQRLSSCMITSTIEQFASTWYQAVASKALTAVKKNRIPTIDPYLDKILKSSQEEATELGANAVTSEHVFLAILNDKDEKNKVRKAFNKAGITYNIFKSKISENGTNNKGKSSMNVTMDMSDGKPSRTSVRILNFSDPEELHDFLDSQFGGNFPSMSSTVSSKKRKAENISQYCSDLNNLAEMGKIDPLVGRDKEINEIIRILGRKKKNNAILLGGEGVGKTAIGEALALKIVNKDVPDFLLEKRVVSLDMTALLAGTTLRGMFEERVKGVIEEIKQDGNIILFMDNIGAMLADKGKNDFEISAMLSRALENGEVQVIGTSDFASYRKTFDSDPSLARRFQKIIVEPSTIEESIEILNGIKKSYEDYHKVKYTDDAIVSCVKLADRYISERNLPDSAIDILDEIGASKSLMNETEEQKKMKEKIAKTERDIAQLTKDKKFDKADELSKTLISLSKKYKASKNSNKNIKITKADILDIISTKTGIPVNNLTSDDKDKLLHMNERLKENVVGQDDAIDTICKALKRNRIGLHKNGCMYSTLMIGKSGVGKCVCGNTYVTIKNKKTGVVEHITIDEFKKRFKK